MTSNAVKVEARIVGVHNMARVWSRLRVRQNTTHYGRPSCRCWRTLPLYVLVPLPSRYPPSSSSIRSFRHLQPIQDHLMSNSWAVNPKDHIDIGPQRTDVDRRDENGEISPCPMTNSQLARPMWSALTVEGWLSSSVFEYRFARRCSDRNG